MGLFNFFNSKPTREKFATLFAASAKKHGYDKPMRFEAEEFRFDLGDGNVFNLDNAYRDYCGASKTERHGVLSKYAAGLDHPEVPSRFEDAKPLLMPIIRGCGQNEYMRLEILLRGGDASHASGASQPFSDDATLQLAYDSEHSLVTIGMSTFEKWGISIDLAMEAAIANLRDRSADKFLVLDDGVVMGHWSDAYDSSRALLSDVIYRANVGNDPVFMIPTRACLLISSSANHAGLSRMIDYAIESTEKDGRFVSALMYRYREGNVIRYSPDDSAVSRKLNIFKTRKIAEDYASQKVLLDKVHDAQGVDIFVASCSLAEKKVDGNLFTYSTWTKGVDTLLPETDFVILGSPGEDMKSKLSFKMVTWEDARTIGEKIMSRVDGYPARYRVSEFPDTERVESVTAVTF